MIASSLSPRQRPSSRTKEHRASVRTVSRGVRPASCGTSDCYGIRMVRRHCTERTDLILLIRISSQGPKENCCLISFMVRSVWPRERPSGRTTLILCIKPSWVFIQSLALSRRRDRAGCHRWSTGLLCHAKQFVCRNSIFERTASRSTEEWAIPLENTLGKDVTNCMSTLILQCVTC